jgi:hypothetical protein
MPMVVASVANGVAMAIVLFVVLAVGVLFGQRWQEAKTRSDPSVEALHGLNKTEAD